MSAMRTLFAATLLAGSLVAAQAQALSIAIYNTKAAFDGASSTALLEDFSTAPVKDAPLPSLTLDGVTYTGLAGSPFANVFVSSPGYTNYGANVGTTTDYILTANGDEDIVAAFSSGYTALGFNAFFNGLGDGTVTLFGPGSVAFATYTFGGGLDPHTGLADKGYLGFVVGGTTITGFEWKTTSGGRLNTGFTNISVGSAGGVPEPRSWALMVLGFLGLGAALRRSRPALARVA